MARKNGLLKNKPIILAAAGGGLVLVVLVAVFIFGFGFDFVNPKTNTKILTVEQQEKNEQIFIDVNDIIDSAPTTGTDPETGQNVVELTVEEEEMIEELLDEVIPEEPTNQTQTSDDPPLEQICDELDLGCGSSVPPLQLMSKITKIDSNGEQEIVEGSFDVSALSFFIEDVSGKDYQTGRLIIELNLKADPMTQLTGSGKVEIRIGSQVVNNLDVTLSGTTDVNGIIKVLFIGPSVNSETFTFEFANNFNSFANESVTPIKVVMTELNITGDTQNYELLNQELFTMDIARDDTQIIIIDEQGAEQRVYPTDSVVKVSSTSITKSGKVCATRQTSKACGSCTSVVTTGTIPTELVPGFTVNCLQGIQSASFGSTTKPSISSITLFDNDNLVVGQSTGGNTGIIFNQLVTRNANYSITFLSPLLSKDLSFGKAQETQSYSCWYDGTPTVVPTSVCQSSIGGICLQRIDGYGVGGVSTNPNVLKCNFP